MGILKKNRFKENTPFGVKDFIDEPIKAVKTVNEIFITDFESFNPSNETTYLKRGLQTL